MGVRLALLEQILKAELMSQCWDVSRWKKETQNHVLEEWGGGAGVANPRAKVLEQEPR